MTDSKSATSIALSVQEKPLSPAEEVARAVRMRIDTMGLDKLDLVVKELEVSQTLLGSTSWWSEARRLCDEVLAEARKEAMAVQEAREARELLRALVAVRSGIGTRKVHLSDLDSAYSMAFPMSTPLNINKKKRSA